MPGGDRPPGRVREQGMVRRCVPRRIGTPDAERDTVPDLVAQLLQVAPQSAGSAGEVVKVQIGADRGVPAGDVEPDARHTHLVLVRGHSPDRHDVPEVAVGHQGGVLGPRRDPAQLLQRLLFVLSEYLHGFEVGLGGA